MAVRSSPGHSSKRLGARGKALEPCWVLPWLEAPSMPQKAPVLVPFDQTGSDEVRTGFMA